MPFRNALFWTPGKIARFALLVASVLIVTGIGMIHLETGLAYEFHAFFILAIAGGTWLLGRRIGYVLCALAAFEWFLADRYLAGEQSDVLPLAVNTVVRLLIFIACVWLIGHIRRALVRETRLAREDALTGLANRREFHDRGRRAFAQARRHGGPLAAAFIDLDRFKEVNDTLGHEVGDQLLARVAEVMRQHVRSSDVAGRLGGDEFALLLPDMKTEAAADYIDRLRQRLLAAMHASGWPVTFSIGLASYRQVPEQYDTVIRQADALMYEVKHSSRDRILVREY